MDTTGTVTVNGKSFPIAAGASWMDHEWGTSRLESDGVGWDWFALQFDDGRELTWAQIRRADGTANPASFGKLTAADGSTTPLRAADIELEVTKYWNSPRSGARYPAAWALRVPQVGLNLTITPRVADQELPVSIIYWEGAVAMEGTTGATAEPVTGRGYVELTGYVPNGERVPGR
jgi:predicted secreted hydrolase